MSSRRHPIPRLRTKTGCSKCRLRRKKCDETKPRCHGCVRNDYQCVWPNSPDCMNRSGGKISNEEEVVVVSSTSINSSPHLLCSRGEQHVPSWYSPGISKTNPSNFIFATDDFLLNHFQTKFVPTLIRPHAHPEYYEQPYLHVLSRQETMVKKAFCANAALHASWEIPWLRSVAAIHYGEAISSLQKSIDNGEIDGSEDSVLATVIFLFLYESSQCDSFPHIAVHLDGLARIFRIRKGRINHLATAEMRQFYRVVAESFVYQMATLSLYNSDVMKLSTSFSWDDLNAYFSCSILPKTGASDGSPLLGSHYDLYRIISQVSCLCRQSPLKENDITNALAYGEELKSMKAALEIDLSNLPEDHQSPRTYQSETLLYLLSAEILLFKLLHPEACVWDQDIRRLVDVSLGVLRNLKTDGFCSAYFCWPLLILGHAISRREDSIFLKGKLLGLWNSSFCGQVRRSAKVLDVLWHDRCWVNDGNDLKDNKYMERDTLDDLVGIIRLGEVYNGGFAI